MKAYLFPGQGAQFEGMGQDLYNEHSIAREMFDQANSILGFEISKVMFEGSAEDLIQTKITQPAIFLHSVITAKIKMKEQPDVVAGHSLGEFSALVANGTLGFEDGLKLVYQRALAMQSSCDETQGTMAAIMTSDIDLVEKICNDNGQIIFSNLNSRWHPVFKFFEILRLKKPSPRRNRISPKKFISVAKGANLELINSYSRLFIPFNFFGIGLLLNKILELIFFKFNLIFLRIKF